VAPVHDDAHHPSVDAGGVRRNESTFVPGAITRSWVATPSGSGLAFDFSMNAMKHTRLGIGLAALVTVVGCEAPAERQEREAREARERAAAIERKETEKAREQEAKGAKAVQQAKEEAEAESTEAAEALRQANTDLAGTLEKDLDRIDRRLAMLREDLADEKDAAKRTAAEASIAAIETAANDERERVGRFQASSAADLGAFEKDVNQNLDTLRVQITELEQAQRPEMRIEPPSTIP
jgi:hypothetical protein